MSQQNSNNSLPLWGSLLVLPILALAVYLHFNQSATPAINEVASNNPVAISPVRTSLPIETNKPIMPESPLAIRGATTAPDGLDPETARSAVHQVENGVYERATAIFDQEPIDVEWASAYEQSLREMFAQHQGLQRVSVNSINCHTSMCRIEAFTPRDSDADFFTAVFYDGLASFREGELKAEAAITRRMEQGITAVYVARKGHTLGFY